MTRRRGEKGSYHPHPGRGPQKISAPPRLRVNKSKPQTIAQPFAHHISARRKMAA